MATFFSSDHHFGHRNIIAYCERPFKDVNHMHEAMIERWNELVEPDDVVYHLGDFCMSPPEEWAKFAHRLAGRKILVPGNHDRLRTTTAGEKRASGFEVLDKNVVVMVDGLQVWLNHYPLASEDHRKLVRPAPPAEYDIALCGHVHQHWRAKGGVVNVGVDVWNFRPISMEQIFEALAGCPECKALSKHKMSCSFAPSLYTAFPASRDDDGTFRIRLPGDDDRDAR
jgi:calcineurin-like phosphoesterase family protein